jgi:hypothetical protein
MICYVKFHELEYVEAHSHCFDSVRFTATTARRTGLCNLDHSVHCAITHGRAVTFQSLTNDNEKPRWVEDVVLQFLLNEIRVENRSEMRSLGGMSLDLDLEG